MPWVVAALVVLLVQHFASCAPAWPTASLDGAPPHVATLLGAANSTADAVRLLGRVTDTASTWGEGVRLTVDAEEIDGRPATGLVSVSLRSTSRRWRTGDRLALRSRLRRVAGFGNFGELDWAAHSARRGVFVTAYAWDDAAVEVLDADDSLLDRVRRLYADACLAVEGQGAEILEALVIGDRVGIDKATSAAVRDAGLAHFLAISGSHMAVVVALVVALVRGAAGLYPVLLERYDVMRAAAVAAAAAVLSYGAVSGGGVSVARSVLMALAAMAALWRGRPGDDLRALGGSALVLAAAMPGVGAEVGFQLSYLAVTALILDSRRRRRTASAARISEVSRSRRVLRAALDVVRIALICWAVTTPVVAYCFQRVSLVAPLANLLAAPLISLVVVSGLAGLVLLPLWPAAGHAAVLAGSTLAEVVLAVASWCASLPRAAATTPAPAPALTAALSALAMVLVSPLSPRGRALLSAALSLAVAGLLAQAVHERWRGDRLDVWFASVGQGDAAIVRLPGGKVWLVDQGPPGRGRMVVGPLLRRAWVGRVDVLVASHVQADHSGAAAEILAEFEVGQVWLPEAACDSASARALLTAARERGVPVYFVSTQWLGGEALRLAGDGFVEVLAPAGRGASCSDNDHSIVLALSFGGRRVLLTGDIETRAEAALVARGLERVDVLKVAHHGSRTSSTESFLRAAAPALAVVSAGLDNRFGHPAPDVVARYARLGIPMLRTDRDGAVHLAVDADGTMRLRTFRGLAEGGLDLNRPRPRP